jgi:SAM-dependent methyltransferase
MLADLQVLTVYLELRQRLPYYRGDVLDVGCGQSPYRFLLDEETTRYVGIDILDGDRFDSSGADTILFDGAEIPFPDRSFDAVVCTEVLEHVEDFQGLVDEVHRVMKDDGEALFTVPWSARWHYAPHDYFRFSPSALATIFVAYRDVSITPRGTDISTIASKLTVLWARHLAPARRRSWIFVPLWILASPLLVLVLAVAQVCTRTRTGSAEDPLGYTIVARR